MSSLAEMREPSASVMARAASWMYSMARRRSSMLTARCVK